MVNSVRTNKYKKCFVAYLDILGIREKVIDGKNNQETLQILVDSLSICAIFPSGEKKISKTSGQVRKISIQSRFFSDTIVFFLQEKKEDIAQLFFMVRYLQDQLWEKGICLRGAITIGDMYWDEKTFKRSPITVGPALIDTYKLEMDCAIFPRILVSRELVKYIKGKKIGAYPFGKPGELIELIRQDMDGIFFLDLLNKNIIRTCSEELKKSDNIFSVEWTDGTASKRDQIIKSIDKSIAKYINSDEEKIRQKYEWLKNYKKQSLGN